MQKKSLCAIILAAGNSTRFGQNKLLYPVNGRPMYEYTLNLIGKLSPDLSIIVTKYPQIITKIDRNTLVVENNQTYLGQSYSMKKGILAALQQKKFAGYLFTVCDQPYLKIKSLQKLYDTWQEKGGICALSYNKKRGNPVIFSAEYIPELLQVSGDRGGREVIKNHPDKLTLVETADFAELIDIDTLDCLISR